jgi:hypothetical protein
VGKQVPEQLGSQFLSLDLTDELTWYGGMRAHPRIAGRAVGEEVEVSQQQSATVPHRHQHR